jgi:hypothetical protein
MSAPLERLNAWLGRAPQRMRLAASGEGPAPLPPAARGLIEA